MNNREYIRAINVGFLTEAWRSPTEYGYGYDDTGIDEYDPVEVKREKDYRDYSTKVVPYRDEIKKMSMEDIKKLIVNYYENHTLLDIEPWTNPDIVDQRDLELYLKGKISEYEGSKSTEPIDQYLDGKIDVSYIYTPEAEKYYYDQYFKK